jgi:hypothetical protein
MADLNTALISQFLDISFTQWEAVVPPNGVLDDGHGESVAVRFRLDHGMSAYPSPMTVLVQGNR